MRIIAGKAGRTAIQVPKAVTRPTTDFVRQALFSILGDYVENARVLDLFAGSGAIGLEALSRGAASCTFVDEHRQAAKTITRNLTKSRLDGGRVTASDVASHLKRDQTTYDLIFADPPYWKHSGDTDHIRSLLDAGLIPPRLTPNGLFLAEVSTHYSPPEGESLELTNTRTYGSTTVLIYQKKDMTTA